MEPAAVYTHGHHESVLRSHRRRNLDNSAGYLLAHLRSGISVLDVGCGPGTITIDFAARIANGRVVGIDMSEQVIDAARQAAAADERPLRSRLDLEVGDVYSLPFPDATFDIVHAHQVLQHLGDPVAALAEMQRVCRPGGLVAARDSDYAAMTWFPEVPELDRWLSLYRAAARRNGAEPDAGRRLLAWAHEAGFADVSPSASAWCCATPTDRAWWGGLWSERITSSAIATQLVDSGMATARDLDEISRGWLAWADQRDAWFAVLHGEVLCAR